MRDIRFFLKPRYTKSHALVIGIDAYQHASPLSYAANDARAIANLLKESFRFDESDVHLLLNEQATRENILRTFLSFDRSDVDDRVLVFYAGHGYTRSGNRGEVGYLVPYEGDSNRLETLIRWDDLTRNADLIHAKHVFFIMDACYGGLALTRAGGAGSARFLKDMLLRMSRQVLTAGKADEVVADGGGPIPDHSIFTGHLIEGLRGAAATNDGVITAASLMAYVYGRVAVDTQSRQTPHYGHLDGDGDFVFRATQLGELANSEYKDIDRLILLPTPEESPTSNDLQSKVRRLKSLLPSEAATIELHESLMEEVRRLLALTSEDEFKPQGVLTQEMFLQRVGRYEDVSQDLSVLLACFVQWLRPTHAVTLQKVLARASDRMTPDSGNVILLSLRWYPLLICLYCAGIAAVDAERYDALSALFYCNLPSDNLRPSASAMLVSRVAHGMQDVLGSALVKTIPGHERNHVPLSEHLHKVLQPSLDDALFLGLSYEPAFDTFEVLYALAVADLNLQHGRNAWGPLGRFAWKHRSDSDHGPLARIIAEARAKQAGWAPLRHGMFGGSYARFDTAATDYLQSVSRLNWW